MKPAVLVCRRIFPEVLERLGQHFEVEANQADVVWTRDELITHLQGKAGVFVTGTQAVDAALLSACPQLRAVCSMAVGYNNIDVPACTARGVLVSNAPDVLTETTADFGFALMMAAARRIAESEHFLRRGEWTKWSVDLFAGADVHGATLGILGMGRIGQALARRAKGFGLSIHYHNRKRVAEEIEQELAATYWDSLDQMLARMDILSVNCPHTPATFHLLSARRLKLLRREAILVNTARGEVIDEQALIGLLLEHAIAGAGLDVFEGEPKMDSRLLALDNVVLLPHMSSATLEGRIDMGQRVILNIKTFADGHRPPDRVVEGML
jgi:lactate dehydrogenase-like 2-hydroxyacid dehydrogenase